jgi:RNA polymerase sigma factor (sigma-70 family)
MRHEKTNQKSLRQTQAGSDSRWIADRTWGSMQTAVAVDQLKPAQQALLRLRFVEDMALAEMAGVIGVTESAISQRLSTALRVVQQVLAGVVGHRGVVSS